MKKIFLILSILVFSNAVFAQNKAGAEQLVNEGVTLHDQAKYPEALAKYDQALLMDKDNFSALTEKAFTLILVQRYEDAITCCKRAIEVHPDNANLGIVYVTYGNALDAQNKSSEALRVYDEGLAKFPNFYQLYFNKGVTLVDAAKYDEAILAFQKSATLKPSHASSHNALATLLAAQKKNIPSLLASSRFLVLEPKGTKATRNLDNIKTITGGNVTKTGKNAISINLDPSMLGDTTADGKPKENSFANTELVMSLNAALLLDKKYAKYNEAEKFEVYMTTLCASLKENQAKSSGFYWTYYVPFFLEMQEKGMLKTFAYIANASSADKKISGWISEHNADVVLFYKWVEAYKWPE